MNEALEERIREVVATTLGLAPEEVPPTASVQSLPAWSSLAHLRLMSSIEETFGQRFTMREMIEMTSIEGITRVLAGHGVEG